MTAASIDFNVSAELAPDLRTWRFRAGGIGGGALVLTAIGGFFLPGQFFRSYLWSYMLCIGISLGCLAWLMLQYLTGGAWGMVIRRPCEAAARTIPLLVLLFLPIVANILAHTANAGLYAWSKPAAVAADPVLRAKQTYLNTPFFLVRAVMYFGGWWCAAWLLNKWSAEQDRDGNGAARRKLATLSGPGLVFWGFSVTFMAVDWILSLDPHWFSTMFGLLFMANQALSAMAFLITLMVLLSTRRPFSEILTPRHLHDLGNLLLTFVMIWAYFAFSQFLIIWAGNLPDEITWYVERVTGGWQYLGFALIFFHFALPFALLLSRDLKRSFKRLAGVAVFILFMRSVELYWLVEPDFRPGSFGLSWMDITAPIGLGGVWLAYFLTQLGKRPLMPVGDPHLVEALEHGRE
jgi:hypothetical protein